MNFELTEEQKKFRSDIRSFLEEEVPPEHQAVFGIESEEDYRFGRSIQRKLADKGWLTIGWPEEYGGGGKGPIEQSIFSEEMGYRRVPRTGTTALNIVGPAVMYFGTPEQKEEVPSTHSQG